MNVIDNLRLSINSCDYLLIGAGAGLSAADGLSFADEKAFAQRYPYWQQRGLKNEYQMISFKNWTSEQMWAYYAKHILAVRYETPPLKLYQQLKALLLDKDYYIITSNVDRQFYRNQFPRERLFEAQGVYDYLKCSQECCTKLWSIKPILEKMLANIDESHCAIKTELLPRCPYCGAPLEMAFRNYVGYEEEKRRYDAWLEQSLNGKLCILEIGVGFNSPGVIRVPFERITGEREKVKLFRITADYPDSEEEIAYPEIPKPIAAKAFSVNEDAKKVIEQLLKKRD